MFTVTLYKFSKRPNSLKVPPASQTGTDVPCSMKTVSSIITPVIEISDPKMNNSIPLYNYAYISSYQRYYFIEDIRYEMGVWSLWLRCDVLGTYREDIINSRQYVLRSSSDFNPDLVDTLYNTYINSTRNYRRFTFPASVETWNRTTSTWDSRSNYFNRSISQGGFCIGVVGNNTTGVSYYIMPASTFRTLLNLAFNVTPSDMTDVSAGVGKALFNPLQYVTYCKWFPAMPLSGNVGTEVDFINFGGQRVPASGSIVAGHSQCYLIDAGMVEENRVHMDIPPHPQVDDYPYMALSPFSEYSLHFQPFGVIPIDSSKIYDCDYVYVHWYVDYCTGACELQIYADKSTVGTGLQDPLIYSESTQIGVNLPISNLVVDWKTGAGLTALSWLKSLAPNDYASRNMTGGVVKWQPNDVESSIQSIPDKNTSLIDTIMNTVGASLGQISTKGSPDSFLAYNMGRPFIFAYFMEQTAHMPALFGAPCCKNLRLENLSGFCMCSNATVEFSANSSVTVDEQNAVTSMLNSGVYIE